MYSFMRRNNASLLLGYEVRDVKAYHMFMSLTVRTYVADQGLMGSFCVKASALISNGHFIIGAYLV